MEMVDELRGGAVAGVWTLTGSGPRVLGIRNLYSDDSPKRQVTSTFVTHGEFAGLEFLTNNHIYPLFPKHPAMPPPPSLTPAQLALQAERKALKIAKKAAAQAEAKEAAGSSQAVLSDSDKAKVLRRDWTGYNGEQRSLRLVTWNVCVADS
jgi:hypothetical protein